MGDELTWRAGTAADVGAILALFERAYGRRLSPETYAHFYLEGNPFGPPMIELVLSGERIVGHYATCPVVSWVDGALVRSVRSMTTMTDPEFEGRGIFTELAQRLYRRISRDHGIRFVWGFPNPNSHYGLARRLGWSDLQPLFFLDLAAGEHGEPAAIELTWAEASAAWATTERDSAAIVPLARTPEMVAWRYGAMPDRHYRHVRAPGSGAVAVVSTWQPAEGAPVLNVVDFVGSPGEREARATLASVARLAADEGHGRVAWWGDVRSPVWGAMERLRARPRGIVTYGMVLGLEGAPAELDDPRRWSLRMGDSDVF